MSPMPSALLQNLDLKLTTIAVFCKAAEVGSFSAAAHLLGMTPAAVSRGIKRLEDRLACKLFLRTTRSMQLTEDGRAFFEQCKAGLAQIEEAEQIIKGQIGQPKGLLRISVPTTYGHYRLLDKIPGFTACYPDIELDINVSNRNIDFVEEGYDLAIRLGDLSNSRLVARKLEDAPIGLFAHPAYLAQREPLTTPQQLLDGSHQSISFILPSSGRILPWLICVEGKVQTLTPHKPLRVSEDPLAAVTLARAGLGIVQTYTWIAQAHPGELVEVLPNFDGCTRPFHLLYPGNKHLMCKTRALIDYLIKTCQVH